MRLLTIISFVFFLGFISFSSCAQTDTLDTEQIFTTLDYTQYDTLRQEVKYETNDTKLLPREFKKKKKKQREKRETEDLNFLNGPMVKALIYGIIGLLVLAVIYALLGNIKLKKKPEELELVEEEGDIIEDIEKVDTDDGLSKALDIGDHRTACRMIFLKVLQKLEATEKIKWRPEKTNRDYVRELARDKNANHFKNTASVYEKVWYGEKPISISDLKEYAQMARTFITIEHPDL